MKKLIKAALFAVALLMLFQSVCIFATAAENEPWIFIDGENIYRSVNTAVIYRGVKSTGQDIWGYNVIIGSDGVVTDIIAAGESDSADIAVPEGGAVISASGTKTAWFENRIDVGDSVYYDSYTQRLFLINEDVGFDPFISREFEVSGEGDAYVLVNPEISGTPQYTYDIAVDGNGVVVERGSNVTLPEGGFIISAATKADREILIMYAPLGAACNISEGMATFSYEGNMLSRTVELALDNTKAKLEEAKTAYLDVDYDGLETLIAECEAADIDRYETAFELTAKLEKAVSDFTDTEISELRSAFHTPDETSDTLVRATVLKAKAAGLNTIILRTTNGYGTFVPLPDSFRFKQDEKFGGFDVLKSYIDICAEEGMALSLCIDVYYNEYASLAAPEWLSETNGGENGLSQKYFSPASQDFKTYFISYVEYIVTHYNISSLMFDYLRYPKFTEESDLGYDYATLQGFSDISGIPITEVDEIKTELFDSPHWETWVEYRTGLVDSMARTLSEAVNKVRPDIITVSTVERDNVDYYYMQNASDWITDGLFDGLCQVLYEADKDENDTLPELGYYNGIVLDKGETLSAYTGENAYFFVGLESASTLGAAELSDAILDSRTLGADGFVFSSLNSFLSQKYADKLSKGVLRGETVSPFGNSAEAMKQILEYSKKKIRNTVLSRGGCDEDTAAKAEAKIDEALTLLASGALTLEQASALESDIAAIFASSEAKASVIKEFETVTKLARLSKGESVEVEPPVSDPSTDPSEPDNSSSPEESGSASSSENSLDNSGSQSSRLDLNIDFGSVLIYGFVGVAFVAAVAAIVTALRRRKKRPAHNHMPKAGKKPEPDEDDMIE